MRGVSCAISTEKEESAVYKDGKEHGRNGSGHGVKGNSEFHSGYFKFEMLIKHLSGDVK